jgi:hypothetical protein
MQYFKENLMCPPTKDIIIMTFCQRKYTSQYSWCPFITVIIGIFSFKSVFTVEDWTQWPGRIIMLLSKKIVDVKGAFILQIQAPWSLLVFIHM